MDTQATDTMPATPLGTFERNVVRQLTQAEARIAELETVVKAKRLKAEAATIEALKASRANIEQQLATLSTKSDARIESAKADIDVASVALKRGLDEFGRRLAVLAARK